MMADASEFWGPLQWLLSDNWTDLVPEKLIEAGWASPENRQAIAELLSDHDSQYCEEGDSYDSYCKCGKWLEAGYFEAPDHQADILEDSGLLVSGEPWNAEQSG